MKNFFLIILVVSLGLSIYFAYKYKIEMPPVIPLSLFHDFIVIKKIAILENGHEFDILLEDNRRIHARLQNETPPEAKNEVVRLINCSTNPKLFKISEDNGVWIVEIYLTTDGKEIILSSWLRERHLLRDK